MSLVDIWQSPPIATPSGLVVAQAAQAALLGQRPTASMPHVPKDDTWSRDRYPLLQFVQEAWPVLEPKPYIHGWYIDALCQHLEAIARRDIKRLLVNLPMRSGKSLLQSVFFPAWIWITQPEHRFLCTSYSKDLALRDSVRCRMLMLSPWYKERWRDRFSLQGDLNIKSRFANNKGGYRITSAVGGATGDGGDTLICLAPGQRIITNDGWIPIDRIVEERLPVQALSFNHQTCMIEWQQILACHHNIRKNAKLRHIVVENGPLSCALDITENHPIYIKDKGYVRASDVHIGDIVYASYGIDTGWQERRITDSLSVATAGDTYNLAIAQNNNYFAEGMLVHNCDDLHSRNDDDSPSRADIKAAIEFFNGDFAGCLTDPESSAIIVSGQRIAIDDISADILAKGGYTHLKIRQEYVPPSPGESKPVTTTIGWSDPRTELGELMHPERWGSEEVAEAKRRGMRKYLAHHQQDPEGSGGNLFNDAWWYTFTQWPELVRFKRIIQSWDMRFKDDKETGSFVVGQVWGLAPSNVDVYLLDEVRGRWSFEETKDAFRGLCQKWPQARTKLIENKANGPAIYSAFRTLTYGIVMVDVEGTKLARAENHTGSVKAGNVWLPAETLVPWIGEWRVEAQHFPSEPDDRIDAATQAWDYLLPHQLAEDPLTEERKARARRQKLLKRAQQHEKMTWSRTGA